MITAAMIQMSASYDRDQNLSKAVEYVEDAASKGAQIVCLQELFNTIYFPFEIDRKYFDWAESMDGPTVEKMRGIAAAKGIIIIVPIFERALNNLFFNTAVLVGPSGEILGYYRKSHIPLITTTQLNGFEKYYFTPGDTGFRVFDTPFGVRIGILICYDRHFPEGARALALKGAEVVFVPTATAGMSRYLWELELRAHAVDNVYFVGGVNRVGFDERGSETKFYGSSLWVDPRGTIIGQANDESDEILMIELDLSKIPDIRNEWGFFRDRRPDLYGGLGTGGSDSR